MKTLMIFDLDGTLAPSKSALEKYMADHLVSLLKVMKVAVISGGAWPQFEKQLLSNLPTGDALKNLSLLPTSGTRFLQYEDKGWKELYAENFTADEKKKIIDALNKALDQSGMREKKHWGEVNRRSRQPDHHVRPRPGSAAGGEEGLGPEVREAEKDQGDPGSPVAGVLGRHGRRLPRSTSRGRASTRPTGLRS